MFIITDSPAPAPGQPQSVLAARIAALNRMMCVGLREPREVHSIEGSREELPAARLATLDNAYYVHVCMATTGAGKSHADVAPTSKLYGEGKKAVILVPTHRDCQATVARLRDSGIPAEYYPHLNEETCQRYDEAEAVIELNLSPRAVLCEDCQYREGCPHDEQYRAAVAANIKVATQARGRVSLPVLTEGCSYLSVHEDCLDLLAPTVSLGEAPERKGQRPNIDREHPLQVVARIAEQAALTATNATDRGFYRTLAGIARYLDREHHGTNETCVVLLPQASHHKPRRLDRDLHDAVIDLCLEHRPPREAMGLALAAAQGQLQRIYVVMYEHHAKGGAERLERILTGVGKSPLPRGVSTVLNDATADLGEIRAVLAESMRPVHDITPPGRIPLVHPVLQICPVYDVTRKRDVDHVADILRGIMHDLPQFPRVGLLTHSTHYGKVRAMLGEPYTSRITMEGYFGDGLSRGSNEWLEACDVIIVLGTPRPGSNSIREYLGRTNKMRAARLTEEQAGWDLATWTGITESGETREIETLRHLDEDWYRAYCNITKAQLKQAIGRGRGILLEGIPVYVVTTEDICGGVTPADGRAYPIADAPFAPLKLAHVQLLHTLEGTSGSRPMKTGAIARVLGCGTTTGVIMRLNRLLTHLMETGRVKRKGKRKGWYVPAREPRS